MRSKAKLGACLQPKVGERSIGLYLARGMRKRGRDTYCVEECQAWVNEHVAPKRKRTEQQQPDALHGPINRGYWEAFKARESAMREQLKRKREAGELIGVDDARRLMQRHITQCRVLLEQIPDRSLGLLPPGLSEQQVRQHRAALAEMIDDACFELVQALEAEIGTIEAGAEDEGAEETES